MTAFLSHRLRDHFAAWLHDDTGRRVGLKFLCPTCPQVEGAPTICVLFENPLDGAPVVPPGSNFAGENEGRRWSRVGDDIEHMTLSPSVDCSKCGHWHGFVHDGVAN